MKYFFVLLAIISLVGIASADTLLKYSAGDGQLTQTSASADWQTLRDGTGSAATDNATAPYLVYTAAHASTANKYIRMYRYGVTFDTSSLGSGSTISSAVLRIKYMSKTVTLGGTNETALVAGNPDNPLDYATGDYDNLNLASPTELASRIDFTNQGAGNLNFTLNADGRTWINKTGLTVFYALDGDELDNSFSGVWAASTSRILRITGASDATEANHPYLQIEYTPAAGGDTTPPASITGLDNSTTCSQVNFTWTNPTDADFNGTQYWLNGTLQNPNLTNTTTFKLIEGLSDGLSIEFASKTFDNVSNINASFKNMTAITKTSPTASFTKNATDGLVPFHLQVNDTSTGSSLSMWNISWGDSTWSNTTDAAERNATHIYGTGGNYTIFLITSNSCGSDQSDNQYVDVWNVTTAGFSANETAGATPMGVAFTDSSANATIWSWDIDGDGVEDYTTQNIEHEYTVPGTYTVNLTAGNGHSSDFENKVDYITVLANGVTAAFSGDPTSGLQPLEVTFTDSSLNATAWDWNFGDGSANSTDQNPVHTYSTGGIYPVFLNASNTYASDTETKVAYIEVWNVTTAGFSADPLEGKEPLTVAFTDASANATTWSWDIDDDGDEDYNTQNPSHEYTAVGLYTVNLTVGNGHSTDFERKIDYINVTDGTPPASITELTYDNTTVCEQITWNWVNPADPDLDGKMIYNTGVFVHNATAGSTNSVWGTLIAGNEYEIAIRTFDNATPANVNMTWTNATAIPFACAVIPVADFTTNQSEGFPPLGVEFTDTSTNDPESWNWSFGDGTFSEETDPVYVYGTGGNYTVNLTVTNGAGSDSVIHYIEVWNYTTAGFSADVVTGGAPLMVTFTDESANATWWSWDIDGDDVEDYTDQNPVHEYTVVGLYTVNLTVSNGHDSDFELKTNYINVTDGTPPASITNLVGNISTCGVVQWNWTNPVDADYSHLIVYKNGEWHSNVSAPTDYLNWTGLTGGEFASHTCDTWGNCNTTWINETIGDAEACDVTPPLAPTPPTNVTTCNSINWTWEAQDEDYHGVLVYRFDEGDPLGDYFYHFVIEPTFHDLWSGLAEDTDYTISLKSWDGANVNDTWVNMTAHTPLCPVAPVVDFHADNTTPIIDQDVHFSDDSLNTPTFWEWDFGDGNGSNLEDPTHAYAVAGTYTVTLYASNDGGDDEEIKVDYIVVSSGDEIPPASITDLVNTTTTCNSINWTWTNPADPDYSRLVVYHNGTFFEYVDSPLNSTLWTGLTEETDYEIATHTEDAIGNINLTWENRTAHTPTCPPALPVTSFTSNVTCGNVPFDVQFNDTSTGTGITDYYWEFGDGNTSTDKDPVNTYSGVATFGVNHSVTNGAGTVWSNITSYMRSLAEGENCTPAAPVAGTARYVVTGQGSILLYALLGLTSTGLALYGLYDLRNKFYANIGSLFMSSLLLWYLSTVVSNGTLQYGVVVDQVAMTTTPIIIQDGGFGILIAIPAIAAMIVVAYLIYDAYDEKKRYKADAEENPWGDS
ncbi:MAG: PKD domain-containing protein [Methanoregula sp.]|jgi:PKD repeat protein|nr:PKD domain-containing protein [Methanoregula sp.]